MRHFNIDLATPIEARYKEVIEYFGNDKIKKFGELLNQVYKDFLPNIPLIDSAIKVNINMHKKSIKYRDEIKFWAKTFDMPFYRVMMLQLLYEMLAGCTTVCKNGLMFRTMDWHLPFLKEMTYSATFTYNSKPVYDAVCWLGSVGVFTGKNSEYSIAINYRRITTHKTVYEYFKHIHSKYKNVIEMYYPVSYLVRHILETSMSKLEAFTALNSYLVVSPTYFILNYHNGLNPVIFQRGPTTCKRFTGKYVVQTNHDTDSMPSENIVYSLERHQLSNKILNQNLNMSFLELKSLFLTSPIINQDTIYHCMLGDGVFDVKILDT